MILDGLNSFSLLATGDLPTANGDTASGNVIDQGSAFGPKQGGAYVAPFLVAKAFAGFTTGSAATLQIVLQDSPDNITFTDRALGPVLAVAACGINAILATFRIPASLQRYLRLAYRIGTGTMTAGAVQAFLTLDTDVIDLTQRKDGVYVSAPTGALDESVANGVAGS